MIPPAVLLPNERKAITSLASLYAMRMLGLFMVLPVMMLEGRHIASATPQLLGIAIGVYGLTQALLQIPAGALSDRIGRKPVIIGGLVVFAAGSLVAALSDSVYGLILGRALQGGGAIASAIMALVTDLTREENRLKAMSFIGASIGVSFSVALVLGPALAAIGGLQLIFAVTTVLALVGMIITITMVPAPAARHHRDSAAVLSDIGKQLQNTQLWPLNLGVFLLHAVMVAIFVAIPSQLLAQGLTPEHHTWLYLPVLLIAFVLMVPCIIIAEKHHQMKSIVMSGAMVLAIVLLLMSHTSALWHWALLLLLYFWAFNLMEASLPSWLSKIAPAGARGSAMGIYSSMQFFGAFCGGVIGGWLLEHYNATTLFITFSILMMAWLMIIWQSSAPQPLTSIRLALHSPCHSQQLQTLMALPGVSELNQPADELAIYLKVNADTFDHNRALAVLNSTKGDNHGSQS